MCIIISVCTFGWLCVFWSVHASVFCIMGINRDKGLEETTALVVAYGRFAELKMMPTIK